MKYLLTQPDLLLLAGLMPIPMIAKSLPGIAPPISSMYRRLKADKEWIGETRINWQKSIMSRMPDQFTDVIRDKYFNCILNACREEVLKEMKSKAEKYERLTQ